MALARVHIWIAGEVLLASDLNTEFNNIITNAASLFSPLTSGLDVDGFGVTLDAAGVTTFTSTTGVSWSFTSGAKTGTPGTTGTVANWTAQTFTDSATAISGTAALATFHSFARPTLVATNATVTTTDAATIYVANAPLASTNETITNAWAILVAAGATKVQALTAAGIATMSAAVNEAKGADIASASTLNLTTATGNGVHITGTTTITAVTLGTGMRRSVIFDGALTLTHHATNNSLPGGADITTAAGDRASYWADGTTVYCTAYVRSASSSLPIPAKQPTRTVLTSGTGATYTTPTGATRINPRLAGGGAGGAGATANNGTAGNNTTFGTLTASGGSAGVANGGAGGAGGGATGGDVNIPGGSGCGGFNPGGTSINAVGGAGGNSAFGGAGGGVANNTGMNAAANSGGGGAGGGGAGGGNSGGGGGGGGYVEKLITAPAATYTYTVGAAANGGAAGTNAGGNGAAGIIIVDEYYN